MTNRSPTGNREPRSRARSLGFRFAAILLGLLPFAIAEATLRLLDLPARTLVTDPFLDCSQLEPLFKADTDGTYRIPSERLRLFAPAEFSCHKASNTCRVFSLGESTTQGEPYGPPTAFTAWLGINLQMISPDRNWEMVNCGGLSYASYRILPILHEVLDYDPDLIVIYCGQNEFLEDRELSGWKQTPIEVVRTASKLSRLRVIQWATLVTKPAPEPNKSNQKTRLEREVDALLDSQGGLEKYHRDPLRAEAVVASHRWNLQQMVTACQARNIPLVLVIPTVNLRDCPPFKIEIDPELGKEELQDVESLWRQAHEDREHPEKVRVSMQEILKIDAQHCGAHYYLGQQAIAEQNWEQARIHLIAAKNYDVCPLRATTAIQETVREIATKNQVMMLDADELFQSKSPQRLVGKRWLIDHIHPNIEGHQLLGEALAELLVKSSWLKPSKEIIPVTRTTLYREHISHLGEDYFIRGQQRLEGLLMWTQGRAKQVGVN